MKAIEFFATAKQGKVAIPKEYLDEISGEIRVILLFDKIVPKKAEAKRSLKAAGVRTKGLKFDRDEANQR